MTERKKNQWQMPRISQDVIAADEDECAKKCIHKVNAVSATRRHMNLAVCIAG